jgi:hypothetical protein
VADVLMAAHMHGVGKLDRQQRVSFAIIIAQVFQQNSK